MYRQNGNILFLILIAVALFAALSYAVTSSMRTSGDNGNKESADVQAAVILQYATLVETSIERLRVLNGLAWDQVDLYNFESRLTNNSSAGPPVGHNPNCLPVGNRYWQPQSRSFILYY